MECADPNDRVGDYYMASSDGTTYDVSQEAFEKVLDLMAVGDGTEITREYNANIRHRSLCPTCGNTIKTGQEIT